MSFPGGGRRERRVSAEGEDDEGEAPAAAPGAAMPLPHEDESSTGSGKFGGFPPRLDVEPVVPESMYLPIDQARAAGGSYIVFPEDPFRLCWDMGVLLIIFCTSSTTLFLLT